MTDGRQRDRAVSLAPGALLAGPAYWLGIDPLLSGRVGLAPTANVRLLLRVGREFPECRTGDWRNGRWTGFPVCVLSVGPAGAVGGSLAEMERDRLRAEPDDCGAVPADD